MELGYLNARVRAWKGTLFSREEFESLYGLSDINDLIKWLEETPYGRDIAEAKSRYKEKSPLQLLTPALYNHIVRIHQTLRSNCPEEGLPLLDSVVAPFEVYNIKTIMRGIENSIDPEELFAATMPTWRLDTKALKELIAQEQIRAVISLLDTWGVPYGKPLREGYEEYEEEKRLSLLEMGLDRFVFEYYRDSLDGKSEDGRIARALLARKIDIGNILNALKFVSERFLPDHPLRYYIRGGAIDEETFLRLSELSSVGELLETVPSVLRGKEWEGKMENIDLSTPLLLETFLNKEVRRFVSRSAVERPLSIAVPIAFLYAKYSEVERLRLIAAGISFTIPRSDLRGMVDTYQ